MQAKATQNRASRPTSASINARTMIITSLSIAIVIWFISKICQRRMHISLLYPMYAGQTT